MDLHNDSASRLDRARTSLEGLSVGDAFGERFFGPLDAVIPQLAARELPPPPWTYTDDTEMALALVESLADHESVNGDGLARAFVRRYVAEPDRGYGAAAVQLLIALREGAHWRDAACAACRREHARSNDAAMRVAPLGAYFADDLDLAARQAEASAQVTHAHPDGAAGAIAVAVAAAQACRLHPQADRENEPSLLDVAVAYCPPSATRDALLLAQELPTHTTPARAARALGNGSQSLSSDTVPFALWCAQMHLRDYAEALWHTVSVLGDRDTTCAIVGGIVGLVDPPPRRWLQAREDLRFEKPHRFHAPDHVHRITQRIEAWLSSIGGFRQSRS